ncbi:MAG: hypothetical protein HZA11_06570, partial [Nitrospirae bacterium]|nr:hypothetical protein [Nitrospirota bacterium]
MTDRTKIVINGAGEVGWNAAELIAVTSPNDSLELVLIDIPESTLAGKARKLKEVIKAMQFNNQYRNITITSAFNNDPHLEDYLEGASLVINAAGFPRNREFMYKGKPTTFTERSQLDVANSENTMAIAHLVGKYAKGALFLQVA